MSRAARKHQRPAELSPEQKAEYGISDRDIPGGATHLVNPVTVSQATPVPEPLAEHRGMMAHGVPPDGSHYERQQPGKPYAPHYADLPARPSPVPVYIVPGGGGAAPLKIAVPRRVSVPGFGSDPIAICGRDVNRTKIRLMNTDSTNSVRIARDPTALIMDPGKTANTATIGGALLPKAMTSYQDIETQDELWAIALTASTAVELDIIMETSIPGAG